MYILSLTTSLFALTFCYMENVFDPLKFYDELKAADVPDKQARAQAEAMRNAFAAYDASKMKELATKGDIQNLRLEIREIELRLIKWMVGIIVTQTALLVAIFAYLK